MSIVNYTNRPAPLAWDVASAIFGADGLEGVLPDISDLSTLFQDATGTIPALPGDPVGLVLDTSGNGHNLSQPTAAARPTLMQVGNTYDLTFDLADDALTTTLPTTITGDILIAGRKGSIIEPFTGNTLTIGPTSYTGGIPGRLLSAIGGIVGVLVIDRSLSQVEKDQLIAYYKGKGAKGLLVPGPELMPNPDFSDGLNSYTTSSDATIDIVGGKLHFVGTAPGSRVDGPSVTEVGKVYEINVTIDSIARGTSRVAAGIGPGATASGILVAGNNKVILQNTGTTINPSIYGNTECVISLFSVRELRPQEDWT